MAGDERPLANFALDKQPLRVRPVYDVSGPVPQLRIDDLIGRRKELRETLRTLRDPARQSCRRRAHRDRRRGQERGGRPRHAAACGGRLARRRRTLGRFDLAGIAVALGVALPAIGARAVAEAAASSPGATWTTASASNSSRKALAEEPVVLVLDDFEQNLAPGGDAFLDPDVGVYLGDLAGSVRKRPAADHLPLPGSRHGDLSARIPSAR